ILAHAEFGETQTQADGMLDMVVNGGGRLVLDLEKSGYLPVQRHVTPDWNEFEVPEDIILTAVDPAGTMNMLAGGMPMQSARGSMMSDADGMRQATVLFPAGTTASIALPNGTTQPFVGGMM